MLRYNVWRRHYDDYAAKGLSEVVRFGRAREGLKPGIETWVAIGGQILDIVLSGLAGCWKKSTPVGIPL